MRTLLLRLALVAAAIGTISAVPSETPRLALGANFNEHLHAARGPALDATGVKWIRGFLPAGEFLDGRRNPATDPRLATHAYLQEASGLENPRLPLGGTQPPWRLNPVFQERHAFAPKPGRMARNLVFFDTFLRHQR